MGRYAQGSGRSSGKPHEKRASEHLYIRVLSGDSFAGRKSEVFSSLEPRATYLTTGVYFACQVPWRRAEVV